MPGSSPLARGTRRRASLQPAGHRFIPARAGNTSRPARARPTTPVHPRSRGEHGAGATSGGSIYGSSPLARGTRAAGGRPDPPGRFIPARAGNTVHPCTARRSRSVHPRSRGEHAGHGTTVEYDDGSSPLARGTPGEPATEPVEVRFIPARAGNTRLSRKSWDKTPVHPRSRGEHPPSPASPSAAAGSSPLARGTPRRGPARAPGRRFIPARAGNTGAASSGGPARSVHPRSRGEHSQLVVDVDPRNGSSPLARGTRRHRRHRHPHRRFIPARAGNTSPPGRSCATTPVHPRSRGEHAFNVPQGSSVSGSSPLARGTLQPVGHVHGLHRFIPARAGNTTGRWRSRSSTPVHPRSRGEHSS